ncbi:hypothetical protein [Serratia sp. FGI94]|uniref:hypothetical protein n=1 Tax=Serratia sp. FGI94 TaxID=671990 RepID=UPI001F18EB7C|nr:hypothetical protein [Serratia sp. FGI94]
MPNELIAAMGRAPCWLYSVNALSARRMKSLRRKVKNDGAIEEGKGVLFTPLGNGEKKIKKI